MAATADLESSCSKLAAALEMIPGCPVEMITLARLGYYSAYQSPLPTPMMQLVADLGVMVRAPGTPAVSRKMFAELAERVKKGGFDPTATEVDDWMNSPEGQEILQMARGALLRGVQQRKPPDPR